MSDRMTRIDEAVREVVAQAAGRLEDPRLGFLTITGVKVARDFQSAKVFVSVLGSDEELRDTLAALRSAHGLLQRAIAREVKLQRTPKLEFVHDDTTDTALRIEALLRQDPPAPSPREEQQ